MEKERIIKRFSSNELADRRARGESQTDAARVHAKTETEQQQDIAGDPDFRNVPANWHEAATAVMPTTKQLVSLRLDTDVVDWFRSQGAGYQTRINVVLRIFVEQQSKSKPKV